jgi:alginate O-acetyltransferase complex protein AlgJ
MTVVHTPNREEQALVEVGRTRISRSTAIGFLILFLLPIAGVPVIQSVLDWRRGEAEGGVLSRLSPALDRLVAGAAEARPTSGEAGLDRLLEVNRSVLSAISDSEDLLESGSFLRQYALPRFQWMQSALFGLGNEQAYIGRDGWLFYRADVDYVLGPGFLEPEVMLLRSRGGDLDAAAPIPDPRPAIGALHDELSRRGIRLIVMPTPVKPSIHPEAFSRRLEPTDAPLGNPSLPILLDGLSERGIEIFDPAPLLAAEARDGVPQFLVTDTHWTPQAVEIVAEALARAIAGAGLPASGGHGYLRREVVVDGRGDIAAMLRLPADTDLFPRQQVRMRRVLEPDGRSWRPSTTAEIVLLGDSFANVFSDPELGWGTGAGLAEQLSFALDRPVARLALNAGGAAAARQALWRDAASGRDRLAAAKVVVYQFATRELAQGSWPVITPN